VPAGKSILDVLHADYLDSALAIWMCKRQFGGTTVIMGRQI